MLTKSDSWTESFFPAHRKPKQTILEMQRASQFSANLPEKRQNFLAVRSVFIISLLQKSEPEEAQSLLRMQENTWG